MLPSDKCEDDCVPSYVKNQGRFLSGSEPLLGLLFSSIPFIFTSLTVNLLVLHKLFPLVSGLQRSRDGEGHYLPSNAPPTLRQSHAEHGAKTARRRIVALTFSTTIALAAVLAELILCEISNSLNPAARAFALKLTLPTLLFFLIVLIPFLELQTIVSGTGWSFKRTDKGRIPRMPWILQTAAF